MPDAAEELSELRARISRLEAIQAIERLKYRYWRACDSKDVDGVRQCFVRHGAEIDYGPGLGPFNDREQLLDVFAELALRRVDGRWTFHDIHHGVHPDIELIDDKSAVGRWTFGFTRVNLVDQTIERASLEYHDRYVVDEGDWRIQRSRVTPLTSFAVAIPEGTRVGPGPRLKENE
jgi:SnoaL-like domain